MFDLENIIKELNYLKTQLSGLKLQLGILLEDEDFPDNFVKDEELASEVATLNSEIASTNTSIINLTNTINDELDLLKEEDKLLWAEKVKYLYTKDFLTGEVSFVTSSSFPIYNLEIDDISANTEVTIGSNIYPNVAYTNDGRYEKEPITFTLPVNSTVYIYITLEGEIEVSETNTTTGVPLYQVTTDESKIIEDGIVDLRPINDYNFYVKGTLTLGKEAESTNEAVRLSQMNTALALKAEKNGDETEVFKVANSVSDDDAVNQRQLSVEKGRIDVLETTQFSGIVARETLADEGGGKSFLPPSGAADVLYEVTNDPDPLKNGRYTWDSSAYVKADDGSLDDTPTEGSAKGVKSGGVAIALANGTIKKRKNKELAFDLSDNKLKIVGSDSVSPLDTQVFTYEYNDVVYQIKGAVGAEFELAISNASHSQIGFLTTVSDPNNVQITDFVFYNDNNAHADFVKLAHIVYGDGFTSKIIKDARYFVFNLKSTVENLQEDVSEAKLESVFNSKTRSRKRKWLAYDRVDKKLKVVGSDSAASSENLLATLYTDEATYVLKGFVGTEHQTTVGTGGNCQLYIPKSVTPGDVQISDIESYNDAVDRSSTHLKIAHITYNDSLDSNFIIDYQDFLLQQKSIKKTKFFVGDLVNNSFNLMIKDIAIYGSDEPSDNFYIHTVTNNTTGNHRIYIGKRNAVTGSLDRVATWYTASTEANTGIETISIPEFNSSGLSAKITIDWNLVTEGITYSGDTTDQSFFTSLINSDFYFLNEPSTETKVVAPASHLNNSVGETNFANGVQSNLKILAFGNSFMRGSVHYLSALAANGLNVNLTVGNLYTGGTNLDDHLSALNNDTSVYGWYKYENGVQTISQGGQKATVGLTNQRWDAIIMHQYQPWLEDTQPNLNKVMTKIIEILGYCPKFYFNATWGWDINQFSGAGSTFPTEEEHRAYMLADAKDATEKAGIIPYSIIPTGTAIQNARTLSYANDLNRYMVGGTDWHHINPVGGFITAATIYQKIVTPLNGVDCTGTTLRIESDVAHPPTTLVEEGMHVTDTNYLDFCNSAIDAVNDMDNVTNQ